MGDKIKIQCHTCDNIFDQTVNGHIRGAGCPKCGDIKKSRWRIKPASFFLDKAKEVHGNDYDYSFVE